MSLIEIERKFLLKDDSWKESVTNEKPILQGTITGENGISRIRSSGSDVFITFKGRAFADGSRPEVETQVSFSPEEVGAVLAMCDGTLRKIRYLIPHHEEGDLTWEIDVFLDENEGLVVAEIELDRPDRGFSLPSWIGKEVTNDLRYLNVNLAKKPFQTW